MQNENFSLADSHQLIYNDSITGLQLSRVVTRLRRLAQRSRLFFLELNFSHMVVGKRGIFHNSMTLLFNIPEVLGPKCFSAPLQTLPQSLNMVRWTRQRCSGWNSHVEGIGHHQLPHEAKNALSTGPYPKKMEEQLGRPLVKM